MFGVVARLANGSLERMDIVSDPLNLSETVQLQQDNWQTEPESDNAKPKTKTTSFAFFRTFWMPILIFSAGVFCIAN
jgi:hypothetical protein